MTKILSLAKDLKKRTIEALLSKGEMDLGFEILEGKQVGPGMDPPGESGKSEQKSTKPIAFFSAEQLQIVSMIDQKVKRILKAKGGRVEILKEMHDYMTGFKKVMEISTPEELSELSRQYSGFYHFAQILEDLASGIQSGKIKVPK